MGMLLGEHMTNLSESLGSLWLHVDWQKPIEELRGKCIAMSNICSEKSY